MLSFILNCVILSYVSPSFFGDIVSSNAESSSNSLNDLGDSSATAISSSISNNQHVYQIIDPSLKAISIPKEAIITENYLIEKVTDTDCYPIEWKNTNKQAIDIAVSSQGEVYAIGLNRKLYHYNFLSNTWSLVPIDIFNIEKIQLTTEGIPLISTSSGEIYYYNCNYNWIKLPGCATDIAIGRGGEIYKLGCDIQDNGFSLYKLICDDSSHFHNNKCNSIWWQCSVDSKIINDDKCYWFKLSGTGVKVSANIKGNPLLIDMKGNLVEYEDNDDEWHIISHGIIVENISISNEDEIYLNSIEGDIYRVLRDHSMMKICGKALSIDVGPFGQPFIIGEDNLVYTASKQCFN